MGDTQGGDTSVGPQHLSLPLFLGERGVVVVRVDELAGVTLWVYAADEDVVAGFGPEVEAGVVVGADRTVCHEVVALWRRHVVDLVAQSPGLDVHRVVHACHLVDDGTVGTGHVDNNRC